VLYGTAKRSLRRHVEILTPAPFFSESLMLLGVEVFSVNLDSTRGVAVCAVHLSIVEGRDAASVVATLHRLDSCGIDGRTLADHLDEVLAGAATVDRDFQRPQITSFVSFDHEPTPFDPSHSWTWDEQYSWVMASSTPWASFAPRAGDLHLRGTLMGLSESWVVRVLRDGVAFLCSRPYAADRDFYILAVVYVRTIYLDIVLLGRIEHLLLDLMCEDASDLAQEGPSAHEVDRHLRRFSRFTATIWWQNVALTDLSDQLLRALADQYQLDSLRSQAESDLTALSRQIELSTAVRARKVIEYVAIFAGVLSVAFTSAPLVGAHGWGDLLSLALGGVIAAMILVILIEALSRVRAD
jgi:hypothetical protein